MKYFNYTYITLALLSATVICFEIVTTRIASVIFVSNYAFIIISLAILGLGIGAVFTQYKFGYLTSTNQLIISVMVAFVGITILIFLFAVSILQLTNPFFFFLLLILPFIFAGITFSLLYKKYSQLSFKLYAFDLTGASIGAIGALFLLNYIPPVNGFIIIALVLILLSLIVNKSILKKSVLLSSVSIISIFVIAIIFLGKNGTIGKVAIGNFPEKDFYHVYPNAQNISKIIDSRWSIFGRTDLVSYTNQDAVRQLFIDGSAGSQMYRFTGDVKNPGKLLANLLINHSTAIPFSFLSPNEKNSMLVLGPGGGKEVLIGLLNGIEKIEGIEVNPDFVNIVKQYKKFNGGIYSNFPNVNVQVAEGRHFVKNTNESFDIICMALPSTEQMQSIDNLSSNENYLLTVESIKDYLNILTPEGELILTVHNRWELVRLLVTTLFALDETGINNKEALNHLILLGSEYAPTLVVKKNKISIKRATQIKETISKFPTDIPKLTYLPYNWENLGKSHENLLLKTIKQNNNSLQDFISNDPFDISPVRDDKPFFYKVNRGLPIDFITLFWAVCLIGTLIIVIPIIKIKNKTNKNFIVKSAAIFALLGIGFMSLEIAIFQRFILYLGTPTISLTILLVALLFGMSIGSYLSQLIKTKFLVKLLKYVTSIIFFMVLILTFLLPNLLEAVLTTNRIYNSVICFILLLPFGALLGIPFPSMIKIVHKAGEDKLIPWLYGINGIMSVLGSILAVLLAMKIGFSITIIIGGSFYVAIFILLHFYEKAKLN